MLNIRHGYTFFFTDSFNNCFIHKTVWGCQRWNNYLWTYDLYGQVCYVFDGGKIHYKGQWKGCAMKVETFLGPETAGAKRELIGPKKFAQWSIGNFMFMSGFRAHPPPSFKAPLR